MQTPCLSNTSVASSVRLCGFMSTEVEGEQLEVDFRELWIVRGGKHNPPSYQIRELSPGLPA